MSTNKQSSCRVWSRFEARKKDGVIVKLRIQDAPISLLERVVDFNLKYFATDETFQKAAGVSSNPAAMVEYREIIKEKAQTWSNVICCIDNDFEIVDEILGVSGISLGIEEAFDDLKLQTKEMQTLINILMEVEKLVKPLKKEFEVYYEGRGIIVHPEYRSLGIASEFIRVRRLIINEQNIPMTCAWMTSYGSQKAAHRDNWETAYMITAEELGEKCGVVFKDAPSSFKFMLARTCQNFSLS